MIEVLNNESVNENLAVFKKQEEESKKNDQILNKMQKDAEKNRIERKRNHNVDYNKHVTMMDIESDGNNDVNIIQNKNEDNNFIIHNQENEEGEDQIKFI